MPEKNNAMKNKSTRKNYRFLAYLDEEQNKRVEKYVSDNFGEKITMDAGTTRTVLMHLLNKVGY